MSIDTYLSFSILALQKQQIYFFIIFFIKNNRNEEHDLKTNDF